MAAAGVAAELVAASGAPHPGLAAAARGEVVTPLIRRTPIARAEVALHGPRRAAVLLHAAPGRWPGHEPADRLSLGLGTIALAAHGSPDLRWEAFRSILSTLARRVAAAEGPLPGDLAPLERLGAPGDLAVVPWEGPGLAAIEVHLLDTRGGLVPFLAERPEEAGPHLEVASLGLLIALAADDVPDRLSLALGIEGVLAWYREADRMSAPRNALGFALAHVRERLDGSGRAWPAGL